MERREERRISVGVGEVKEVGGHGKCTRQNCKEEKRLENSGPSSEFSADGNTLLRAPGFHLGHSTLLPNSMPLCRASESIGQTINRIQGAVGALFGQANVSVVALVLKAGARMSKTHDARDGGKVIACV